MLASIAWRERLKPYYLELGIDPGAPVPSSNRTPFDAALCAAVEEIKPEVVSFHFGLPEPVLLKRVKAAGCVVMSSATTVAEARWLEQHGCDVIIAQGNEAGGHRGMFLTDNLATQVGTFALVPQVVDAVKVPVIATGGYAELIAAKLPEITAVNPLLTLEGLHLVWKAHRGQVDVPGARLNRRERNSSKSNAKQSQNH